MKKKVLSLFLALLILFGSMPLNLLAAAAESDDSGENDSSSGAPVVSIEPVSRHTVTNKEVDAPAKPDASGYAHFIIKATGAITGDITVHYTTEDLSAVANAGDYEAKSGAVVLTRENPEVQISIKTSRSEYSITLNIDGDKNGKQLNYAYISRSFLVKLTKVEGNAVLDKDTDPDDGIDTDNTQVECALLAEHSLDAYKFKQGDTVLTPYTYYGKYDLVNFLNTEACASEETKYKYTRLNFPVSWSADYMLDNGIDAKLYMSLQNAHIDESWWNSSAMVVAEFLNTAVYISGEFHDNEEFGWGAAFLYVLDNIEGPNSDSNKYEEYWEENFDLFRWYAFDGTRLAFTKDYLGDHAKNALANNYIIRRAWGSYGLPSATSSNPGLYYISLEDSVVKLTEIELRFKSYGGYSRRLSGGDVSFRLEDISAPQIEKDDNGDYVIYHNFNTVTKGEKLRVAIRFNEPVQLDGKEPYFTGKINGIGTGIEPHPYAVKFNYVGGSGTDTLYFEAEYNGNYHITSITDIQFRYANSIKDFAGVANRFSASNDLLIDGFNLDKREPVVSVSSNDSKMTSFGKSKPVSVTVSNISDPATLYYAWTDSQNTPSSFENKITLNGTPGKDYVTVPVMGEEDGTKYLHLKAVSRYGQEQSSILVVSGITEFKNCLGPYKFDNTPPKVDEQKLIPTDGSNTYQKAYKIPLPEDVGSGFSAISMYYVGEDGKDYLISNKTYTVDDFGKNTTLEVILDAAEIGMNDNERRTVTVFFTLTDAIGNTDEDVARHSVIFDTHTYIDVEYSGATEDFSGKTEVIDDGYTLIYSGDSSGSTNKDGAYYSLELKVLKKNLNGDTKISIKKNGIALDSGYAVKNTESAVGSDTLVTMKIDFTSPMGEGCYDIQIHSHEEDPTVQGGFDHVSRVYKLYVGSGKGKLDKQVSDGTVLINKVYQLPTVSYFYYMDNNYTMDTVVRELYNGTTLSASFSSKKKAREYILFNEYRDIYAVVLTAELAEALNLETSNAQKASGESTVAREGQVWIRYKSAEWSPDSPMDKTKWVYYYYGTSAEIDVAYFSLNLQNALNAVSENIASRGTEVLLPNLSGFNGESITSLINKLGPPSLAPEQIHAKEKSLSQEKLNSKFATDIKYQADENIYSSGIMINGVEYLLFGNVIIPTSSRLQYKRIDENGKEDSEWTELEFNNGQRFGDVFVETGKYKIREIGNGGVSTFNIYIDKEAPMVLVSWKGKNDTSNSQILNKYSENDFRAKSLRIVSIDAREYDKYSFVALYKVSGFTLYGVYSLVDLQKASVEVPDGDYYMVISDRAGNSYAMTLHINSSELKCEITESENVKIKFSCDRKASQIQDFYVKRNGILISAKYASELDFTESGVYEIYVKDIYGNSFGPEFYEFERVYPELEWKYRDETGHYVTYDSENEVKQFSMKRIADGAYIISTSVGLKFKITGDYGYTFIGPAPEYEENIGDATITIKTAQIFQVKVYYKKHPDVYTVYSCVVDVSAPMIDASIQVDSPIPDEIEDMRKALEEGTIVKDGDKLIPSRISYSSKVTQTRYISNKDTVLSDLVKVAVFDESGISYVQVYRNEKLINDLEGEGFNMDIAIDKIGEYRIVAEDMLGNKSEFTFTNGSPESFEYRVDGFPMMLGLHDFENFDENGNYADVCFGNESVSYIIAEQSKIFCMITDGAGVKHFVAFDINDKVIREAYYTLDEGNNVVLEISDKVLFDGNSTNTVNNKEYALYEIGETGIIIYAKININGDIVLKVYSNETSAITVDARLNTEDGEFYYGKAELSKSKASLVINNNDGILEIFESNELVKFNKSFKISKNRFESDKVAYVEVYYSKINDFDDEGYFFKEEIYEDDKIYDAEGFYYIRLVNDYGNESIFVIHISYKFDVTSYSEFADGEKIHFSADYAETLYSDNKVVFEVYANGVTVNVTKDGEKFKPVISNSNGVTYVILSEDGEYSVSFYDMYKNKIERSANINSSNNGFDEDLLIGYNENALKKAEGYTNQKLSVNKAIFDKEGICYLEIQYGDISNIIYDCISENAVALDESLLTNCVGSLGDGVYTVIMRNRYGLVSTKVIHYRETPTLTLERETRSSIDPEIYDISKALSVGFWSNSELMFKTDAEHYVFTINGDKTECPKTLSFSSADQKGRSEYDITYIDEYGFSYSFKAYLVRQDLEIIPELSADGQDVEGVLTTKGDIIISFSENAYCTYIWNNSEEKTYTPGQVLTKDGIYRFMVTDHAGNATALTLKKDTIVEFEFTEMNSLEVIQSGSVINFSKVSFSALNNDSAYIEKVFKNGALQEGFDASKFSEDGKWEMIVSDKLGNKSYFCFYIITKQKDKFSYTTPYEYHVTELWYDGGDGVKISYLKFVNQSDYSSSFEFVENGKYTVVMTSGVTGRVSQFEFTINTNAPAVSLVGCNVGETTINDVTLNGCVIGDTIKIYRATSTGEELLQEIEVTSLMTKMPTISEGGEYRIVVESEAGVATELTFVRKHVMNTSGSIFIMVMIGVAVVGLFAGLVYRNKSKTDK